MSWRAVARIYLRCVLSATIRDASITHLLTLICESPGGRELTSGLLRCARGVQKNFRRPQPSQKAQWLSRALWRVADSAVAAVVRMHHVVEAESQGNLADPQFAKMPLRQHLVCFVRRSFSNMRSKERRPQSPAGDRGQRADNPISWATTTSRRIERKYRHQGPILKPRGHGGLVRMEIGR